MDGYRLALLAALGSVVFAAGMRHQAHRRRPPRQQGREALAAGSAQTSQVPAEGFEDRFLSTVSHELRTPLNAILGWAHVLRCGLVKPGEIAHAIDAIHRNAHAQARLVDELLDASRIIQGSLVLARAPLDLATVIDEEVAAVRPACEARAMTLVWQRPAGAVSIIGDRGRLRQVVQNLLSNALKFTPDGGTIEIELVPRDRCAELVVRDNGVGLDADALQKIFTPFYQARAPRGRSGLGLGLAVAAEIVRLHGGEITASSGGEGRGAVFVARLPVPDVSPHPAVGSVG